MIVGSSSKKRSWLFVELENGSVKCKTLSSVLGKEVGGWPRLRIFVKGPFSTLSAWSRNCLCGPFWFYKSNIRTTGPNQKRCFRHYYRAWLLLMVTGLRQTKSVREMCSRNKLVELIKAQLIFNHGKNGLRFFGGAWLDDSIKLKYRWT